MKLASAEAKSQGRYRNAGIAVLLALNLILGLFLFRDYGLSWDEPLFYDYADALGYAYSPSAWRSPDFDLNRAYGPSGDDHKTRGPAYLLLARGPAHLLRLAGLDRASAWHLVNFVFFQAGVYFLYRLSRRWLAPEGALAAAALFAWQPLLWGHAFINPKDPSFLVFFLASFTLGLEMVDKLGEAGARRRGRYLDVLIPAGVLGLTTSVRIIGPLAGLLVVTYALWKFRQRITFTIPYFGLYGVIAAVVMFMTWPFLWESPLARFGEVLRFMADNPTQLAVLFGGEVYRAGELPRRYLPFMLTTTLTEPLWPLFIAGAFAAGARRVLDVNGDGAAALGLTLLWFLVPAAYVLIRKPSMYDGLRHFLFILPPLFIFAGFGFQLIFERFTSQWLRAGAVGLLLLPGVIGIIRLHPYEYTYYNSLTGGTGGAFRQYETDYWLTCYKEAVEALEQEAGAYHLYVHREAYIAAYYTDQEVADLRGALHEVGPGDYVLVNTRTNEDRRILRDAPTVLEIGRDGATYCVIKGVQ